MNFSFYLLLSAECSVLQIKETILVCGVSAFWCHGKFGIFIKFGFILAVVLTVVKHVTDKLKLLVMTKEQF
jgi:hypothetical protein